MKKFRYSFTHAYTSFPSYSPLSKGRRIYSGIIEADDENSAKKRLKLWERFKEIKDLTFVEIPKFHDFLNLEETLPPVGKPIKVIRYGTEQEVIGWVNPSGKIYIPYAAIEESISNFKLYKVINP